MNQPQKKINEKRLQSFIFGPLRVSLLTASKLLSSDGRGNLSTASGATAVTHLRILHINIIVAFIGKVSVAEALHTHGVNKKKRMSLVVSFLANRQRPGVFLGDECENTTRYTGQHSAVKISNCASRMAPGN